MIEHTFAYTFNCIVRRYFLVCIAGVCRQPPSESCWKGKKVDNFRLNSALEWYVPVTQFVLFGYTHPNINEKKIEIFVMFIFAHITEFYTASIHTQHSMVGCVLRLFTRFGCELSSSQKRVVHPSVLVCEYA